MTLEEQNRPREQEKECDAGTDDRGGAGGEVKAGRTGRRDGLHSRRVGGGHGEAVRKGEWRGENGG